MTSRIKMKFLGANSRIVRPLGNVGQRLARSRTLLQAVVAAAAGKTSIPQKTINVMTYNILAQKYAQSGWHNYCPSRHLRWEYRKALLLEELEAYGSDIICLQEVEARVFSGELQPWLAERGYRGHYLARQYGENVQGPPEGVALFYRTDVFELLQQRSFTFSSVPTYPPEPLSPWLSSSDSEEFLEPAATSASGSPTDPPAVTASAGAVAAAATVSSPQQGRQSPLEQFVEAQATDNEEEEDDVDSSGSSRSGVADGALVGAEQMAAGTASGMAPLVSVAGGSQSSSLSAMLTPAPAGTLAVSTPGRGGGGVSCSTNSDGGGGGGAGDRGNGFIYGGSESVNDNTTTEPRKEHARAAMAMAAAAGTFEVEAEEARAPGSAGSLTSIEEDLYPQSPCSDTQSAASTSERNRSSSSGGSSSSGRRSGRWNNEFWTVFKRRQEGAILALLRHRPTQRLLLAAVTHLFWNPAFPDVKAFQASVLCHEVAAFLQQYDKANCGGGDGETGQRPARTSEMLAEEVPVVLAGDFNSLSHKRIPDVFDPKLPRGKEGLVSGVYTLLTRGSLPPDHPDHPASRRRPGETSNPDFSGRPLTTSGLHLDSAYRLANGRDPPLTTRTATFAGCLDYIFVSPQHFDVTSTLDLPYDLPFNSYDRVRDPLSDVEFPPIPNGAFPSDHISLVAVLKFKS